MLPVANRPVLDVIVQRLAIAGIDRVFLVVGHLASHIQNHFRQSPPPSPSSSSSRKRPAAQDTPPSSAAAA